VLRGTHRCAVRFGLFFATPLFELQASHVHNTGSDFKDIILFLFCEAQHIESLVSQRHFFTVIHAWNSGFALGHEVEFVDVVTDQKHFPESLDATGHDLVEDVVGSFQSLLRDDTGFLQQVCMKEKKNNKKLMNSQWNWALEVGKVSYRFQYQLRPVFQSYRNGYG